MEINIETILIEVFFIKCTRCTPKSVGGCTLRGGNFIIIKRHYFLMFCPGHSMVLMLCYVRDIRLFLFYVPDIKLYLCYVSDITLGNNVTF
jgi:hypothetical protein